MTMTGIALMIRGPGHNFPGAVEFVIAVLVVILAIFFRMYGPRRRSGPRAGHRRARTNINNGRRSSSKRRAGRP
jgi:hypothetical protein